MHNCVTVRVGQTEILSHSVTVLATHGSPTPAFALNAVCQRFSTPLEGASIDISLVPREWDDMVDGSTLIWYKMTTELCGGSYSTVLMPANGAMC